MGNKEIFDIAIEKEDIAFNIYYNLSQKVKDRSFKILLLDLSQQELMHKKILMEQSKAILKEVKEQDLESLDLSLDEYEFKFNTKKQVLELIDYAIDQEIKANKFYKTMANFLKNKKTKEILLLIAKQESIHKRRLKKLKEEIKNNF